MLSSGVVERRTISDLNWLLRNGYYCKIDLYAQGVAVVFPIHLEVLLKIYALISVKPSLADTPITILFNSNFFYVYAEF